LRGLIVALGGDAFVDQIKTQLGAKSPLGAVLDPLEGVNLGIFAKSPPAAIPENADADIEATAEPEQ